MFGFGVTELLVILAIVLLLFGTKKLTSLGSDLGGAIKGFRHAVSTDTEKNVEAARLIDREADRARDRA